MAPNEEFLKPISAEKPSGIRLQGLPIIDQIREARRAEDPELMRVAQLADPSKAKKADWAGVRGLCEETLAQQSKDLQVAVWLTDALIYLEQIPGLTQGLRLCHALLENFWASLYPLVDQDGSADKRAGLLSWLGNYFNPSQSSSPAYALSLVKQDWLSFDKEKARQGPEWKVSKQEFFTSRLASWSECENALKQLEAFCDKERFGDNRPSFGALWKQVTEIGEAISSKLEKEPPPDHGRGRPPGHNPNGKGNSPKPEIKGEITDRQSAYAHVTAAAHFLQGEEPQDPIPYLLLRALRWGELRGAKEEELTELLEAPPADLRADIKRLAQRESWKELLELSEAVMWNGYARGWLDLQRYVVKACEGLGYDAAAKALRSELRMLLADIENLEGMTLLDDTGTANPETLAWLRAERLLS